MRDPSIPLNLTATVDQLDVLSRGVLRRTGGDEECMAEVANRVTGVELTAFTAKPFRFDQVLQFHSLQTLVLVNVEVFDLTSLASLTHLEVLRLAGCDWLTSLLPLGAHPTLHELSLTLRYLPSLEGGSACCALKDLYLRDCKLLESLRPLSGMTTLRSLRVSGCAVSAIEGLQMCTSLEKVIFDGCWVLKTVLPLAGSPTWSPSPWKAVEFGTSQG